MSEVDKTSFRVPDVAVGPVTGDRNCSARPHPTGEKRYTTKLPGDIGVFLWIHRTRIVPRVDGSRWGTTMPLITRGSRKRSRHGRTFSEGAPRSFSMSSTKNNILLYLESKLDGEYYRL